MARKFTQLEHWENYAINTVKNRMNNEETIQTEEQIAEETSKNNQKAVEQEIIDEVPQEVVIPEISVVEKLESELSELKDKYLRLFADFENFRRRTAKEKLELIGTANEELMKAVLPVVDDFERAMGSFETVTEIAPLKEGVGLIFTKLSKTLESKGLKQMVSKGEVFNADLHESITQFPAPTEDLKGKVIDEVEKGYFLNEKVIRYAKVVVGS
ncbi:MAG: nucleotide exchange factor GrpE [Spirosomataceae bacterium]